MIAALALLAAAGGTEPGQPVAEQPTAMIIELEDGVKATGVVHDCAPHEDPGVVHCIDKEFEGQATVIRHLAGPKVKRVHRLRLNSQIGRWPSGSRLLVWTQPFDDGDGESGNLAQWWHRPARNGDFCASEEQLSYPQHPPVRAVFEKGKLRRFRAAKHEEVKIFRCISD